MFYSILYKQKEDNKLWTENIPNLKILNIVQVSGIKVPSNKIWYFMILKYVKYHKLYEHTYLSYKLKFYNKSLCEKNKHSSNGISSLKKHHSQRTSYINPSYTYWATGQYCWWSCAIQKSLRPLWLCRRPCSTA